MEKPNFTDFRNLFEYKSALERYLKLEIEAMKNEELRRYMAKRAEIRDAIKKNYPGMVSIIGATGGMNWSVSLSGLIVALHGKEIYAATVVKRRPAYHPDASWFLIYPGDGIMDDQILSEQDVITGIVDAMPTRG